MYSIYIPTHIYMYERDGGGRSVSSVYGLLRLRVEQFSDDACLLRAILILPDVFYRIRFRGAVGRENGRSDERARSRGVRVAFPPPPRPVVRVPTTSDGPRDDLTRGARKEKNRQRRGQMSYSKRFVSEKCKM